MNRKTKKQSRKLLYVLLVFLTITSCQKESDDSEPQNLIDDNPVSNEYQNRNLDIKVSGYSDFQNDSNFNSIINGLSLSDRFAGNNTANRTGDNDVYGFTIDTTEIRQVQFDNYTSYTFKIQRDEESIGLFENLIVEVNNGEETAYIASYIPDQQYLNDFSNGIITEFNGNVRIEDISANTSNRNSNIANRSGCGSYYVIVETQCPCVGHWPGQDCDCSTQPNTMWYELERECDDTGGYTEGPVGPRGGGGGGGTPTNGDSATPPVGISNSNDNSSPLTNLVNNLNNLRGTNDFFEFNNNLSDNETLDFSSVQEFESFLNSLENSFELENVDLEDLQNGTKITKFEIKFAYIPVYLDVHAKSTLDDSSTEETDEYDLIEVTSFETGITPFLEWEQDSYEHSVNGNEVTIIINGHFNIGISIEGFDISYSDSYVLTIKLNKQTGTAISISGTSNN